MNNLDKPDHAWFISISIIISGWKTLVIISGLLLFPGWSWCQCPGNNFFKEKINSIHSSVLKKNENKIKELLQLRQQMKVCQLEKDSAFMFLLQKIGVIYSRQSNYSDAINFTKQSVITAKECIGNHSCNAMALVEDYYNLKYYYEKTGELEEKYAAIDSCIAYALKGSSKSEKAMAALSDKIEYLFNKGEYSLCIRDAELGENIIQKYFHGRDSIDYIAFLVNFQMNALYFSKDISTAEKLSESRIIQFKHAGNDNQLYPTYELLGLINRDYKKNYTKALSYFREAFRVDSCIKFRKGCAENLSNIGILYAKNFNNFDTGLEYCLRALKYAAAAQDSLVVLKRMGNIYVLKEMYDKAQNSFQRAFNTVQQGMNENTMLQNSFQFPGFNMLQDLLDITTDKGDAWLNQYYHTKNDSFLTKALSIYKKGDLFLAKIKNDQQLQFSSSLVWSTYSRNLYEHAIEACYANNNIEDAFYFFEKSRAILLNDQVNEQRWMSDKDIAKQAYLKKTIIELERNLAIVPPASEQYFKIQEKLNSIYPEVNRLTRNIKNKNPLFYQNYLDTAFLTIPQLRKNILNNSKTLVEIFAGDSAVYVLIIAPNDQRLTKINKQLYDSLSNSFNSSLANAGRLNKKYNDFLKTANHLYGLVFQKAPVDGSIIISPDGVSYPFEALVMNGNDRQPDYFLNHYATSYTYSAKYLINQLTANTKTTNSVLGMAPVLYKKYKNLAELTGSDNSLENINNYFSNTTNYVSEKATLNNFQQNFPRYDIVQLYTHASESSSNNDPVIYFADSALYLSALVPYRKPVTQLVVLSACETANGKLYEGEGIFSFNRGFAALGIPAAISNLWSIENESTYSITELFYKHLSRGLPTDIALQKAKIEFINTTSSKEKKLPYFWAGTILTGKVNTIKSNPGYQWKKMLVATILLLAMLVITRKFIRARH